MNMNVLSAVELQNAVVDELRRFDGRIDLVELQEILRISTKDLDEAIRAVIAIIS